MTLIATTDKQKQEGMQRRQIVLADGRYLIFYTFENEDETAQPSEPAEADRLKPEPEQEEKQRV